MIPKTNADAPAIALSSLVHRGPGGRWRTEAMRSHATPRLIYITKGQGRITIAGLTNGYGPNNLIFVPAHTVFGIEVGPTVFGQILTLPQNHLGDWPDTAFHLRLMDVHIQKELIGLMEALEKELQSDGDIRAARCHLGLLMIFVERQLKSHPASNGDTRRNSAAARLVARYTSLIAQNFKSDWAVADYATQLNVTPTHLTRICKQSCDRTALELLNDRIYYEACKLLQDTETPIKDVATSLGFQSPAYFTRSFQARSGRTPSAFRKTGGDAHSPQMMRT